MKRQIRRIAAAVLAVMLAAAPACAGGEALTTSRAQATETTTASGTSGSTVTAVSQPKLMVTNYSLASGKLYAGQTDTLSVTVHNTSTAREIRNLKMTFSDPNNEIVAADIGTKYLSRIRADGWYQWDFDITAVYTAQSGVHPVTITMEYEDADGNAYTATDTLSIELRQSVQLSYEEPALDSRLTQGDTPTFSMQLMNTGKSTLSNVLLTFDIPGIADGGSVLIGTIEPGETQTGTTNLRVDADTLGEVEGTVTLSYEDDFGQTYTEVSSLATTVEAKQEIQEPEETAEEAALSARTIVVAVVVGIAVLVLAIVFIVRAIKAKRAREEDERRL